MLFLGIMSFIMGSSQMRCRRHLNSAAFPFVKQTEDCAIRLLFFGIQRSWLTRAGRIQSQRRQWPPQRSLAAGRRAPALLQYGVGAGHGEAAPHLHSKPRQMFGILKSVSWIEELCMGRVSHVEAHGTWWKLTLAKLGQMPLR